MKTFASNNETLHLYTLETPYIKDPSSLFSTLCNEKQLSLLLESATVDTKKDLKSLMLIDTAVRVVCHGPKVELQALTENGRQLLNVLEESLTHSPIQLHASRDKNTLLLTVIDKKQKHDDEDARLCHPSSFDALRLIQNAFSVDNVPHDALFIAGLFSYDLVAQFEPLPNIKAPHRCPDYVFYVAQTLLIIDHKKQTASLQATQFGQKNKTEISYALKTQLNSIHQTLLAPQVSLKAKRLESCPVRVSVSDSDFCKTVEHLKKHIIKGDVFQVVPSRSFSLPCPSALPAYRQLKKDNPSPYMFYMQDKDFILFGASPESALKYTKETNQVEIYPIAGTRPRGKKADGQYDLDLDGRIELELRNDKKENAEHMMLVDLARNDIARICDPGTRRVAELLKVDRYSHVMHLVSRVVGQLKEGLDALHAYQASMNMGTLTGAPKIRAMQLIREYEQTKRGSYGGAVGYITGQGDMDTCIVIRSAYVEDEIAYVQSGAGVVFDSVPEAESAETTSKAQAVLNAIIKTHTGKIK